MEPFTFGEQDIHVLDDFPYRQKFTILIGSQRFQYSFEQLAFLSPFALSHFIDTTEPFQIEVPISQNAFYIDCFTQLDSLFHSSSKLQITPQNAYFFSKIAETLDNSVLLEVCESFFDSKCQNFSFSSHHLNRLWMRAKSFLKNFTLIINNNPIQINYSLFCCVSDLLRRIDPFGESLTLFVSDDVFHCFSSFIKIFDGIPFYWKKFSFLTLSSMIETFNLFSLQSYVAAFIPPLPKNIENSIQFLSQNGLSSFGNVFQQSVSVIVDNFDLLTIEQLSILSYEALQEIFQSNKLKAKDQNYLLRLIIKLIEKDPNKKALLKNVKLRAISSQLMKEFFNVINVDDVDFDLFEQLRNEVQHLKDTNEDILKQNTRPLSEIQSFQDENKRPFAKSIKIPWSGSSRVDLFNYQNSLDKFEHWIIVSSDFNRSSFTLKTDPTKTAFIILDQSITEIYHSISKDNNFLKSVSILHPLKIIGQLAFCNFCSLQSVTLPNTVTCLDISCFNSCSSLRSISLPSSLMKLERACFWGCTNLSYIFIPKSVVTINSSSFCFCDKLFDAALGDRPKIEIGSGSKFTPRIIQRCQINEFPGKEITP